MKDRSHNRFSKTIIISAVLLTVAGATVGCTHSGDSEPAHAAGNDGVPAAVVKVVRKDLSNELEIASEFIPYQEIEVDAKVSGYVKNLYIDWGTHVHQGQLMAILEVPELDAQVARDQAAVQRSQQNLARAREELSAAQSAYTVAHLTYSRLAGVQKVRPDLVAQEEVDVAQGKDAETSASVSAAKDALAAAQEELVAAQSSLVKDQAFLAYSRISAPFDGVVTRLNAYTGALLPAGTSNSTSSLPLCRLSQNDLLRLVIPVPEHVVPEIHLGEPVNVRVDALSKVIQGKIARTSGQIDMDTRTMHTEVEVPNPNYELVPGMYANVQIPVKSAQNAIAIPIEAFQSTGTGKGTVLVVNSQNLVEPRKVTLGIQTANDIQILSGLRENETVIYGEQGRYRAGELVKPSLVSPSMTKQVQ